MVKWRIKRGDKIAGEVPSSKVRQLAAAGKLRKTDLLCKEGTEKWVPAGNVKGLWQTSSPNQTKAAVAKDQNKAQPAVASSPASASKAVQTAPPEATVVTPPQQEAFEATPSEPLPQQEAVEPLPQQEAVEAVPQEEAIEEIQNIQNNRMMTKHQPLDANGSCLLLLQLLESSCSWAWHQH